MYISIFLFRAIFIKSYNFSIFPLLLISFFILHIDHSYFFSSPSGPSLSILPHYMSIPPLFLFRKGQPPMDINKTWYNKFHFVLYFGWARQPTIRNRVTKSAREKVPDPPFRSPTERKTYTTVTHLQKAWSCLTQAP